MTRFRYQDRPCELYAAPDGRILQVFADGYKGRFQAYLWREGPLAPFLDLDWEGEVTRDQLDGLGPADASMIGWCNLSLAALEGQEYIDHGLPPKPEPARKRKAGGKSIRF